MSNYTGLLDLREVKQEIINYIYSKVYSLDPKSRITRTTASFSGDDSETLFFLNSDLRFISEVTVDGTQKYYGDDWTFVVDSTSADKGKIEFTSAPATGTDNISVTYGYGKGWVYPDFPRNDLALSSYPRIAIGIIENPQVGGFGANQNVLKNDIRVSVFIVNETQRLIDELAYTIKNNIVKDAKKFYNWRYIEPSSTRDLQISEDGTNLIPAFNQDYMIKYRYSITAYN